MKNLVIVLFASLSCLYTVAQDKASLTSGMLGTMQARHIGPAATGGRITAIDAVTKDPRIVYVGTAGGGVWKSTTGGTLFNSVFDKYTQSVGAVAIDQQHPDTVWAGTGESNMRNSVSIGTGIYKTTDGGENWVKMGLDSSEHISKIIVHPTNSNVVYVAVPGHLWNDNKDRGLYKTIDGGKTWNKILYVDVKTGCAEVVMDPKNPETIYATMWQFRRTPFSFTSGSKTGGIFKSTDGGKTWKKMQKGLPDGDLGRICLAIAPSEPNKLFAIAESKNTGLYLSGDGGESWAPQSATSNVTARPFYFSTIVVDPNNSKRVYRPAFNFSISDDGGMSFTQASFDGGWVHSDMHALWINPSNTSHMLLGTDGGVYMSLDKGNNWMFLANMPVSQFYHASVDNQEPYNVYGGLQDNGSWMVPSQSIGGIENGDWKMVGWGDGFWVQPDLTDPAIVFSESQGGFISRYNHKTNEWADIQPQPLPGEPKLRFNWNTPIVLSVNTPGLMYTGAQYLYRTRNKGITWERISGDLTTNDPKKQNQEESGGLTVDNSSAENHCTIFAIAESPKDANLIWVGTDDGNLQVTTDGGKTWAKVNQQIKGLPKGTWVSSIEPGRFDKNTVYTTFDNHTYGDMKTYVFKSTDLGKTWKQISSPEFKGYAHKIREDLVNPNILFVGTELGLYVSINGGESWTQMTAKIPTVAVRDIVIHPKTNDLILATHGRGVLIVDDISPLRQITPELLKADVVILPSRPTPVSNGHFGGGFGLAGSYVGPNSTEDAVITYFLKERVSTGDIKIEVYDSNNKLINSVPGTKRKGINKVTWSMRMKPPRVATGVRADGGGFTAPLVPVGTYTVKLIKGDKAYEGKLELIKDPLSPHSAADIEQQSKTVAELYRMQEDLAFLVKQINTLKDTVNAKMGNIKQEPTKKTVQVYADSLESLRKTLVATKGGTAITGEEQLREKLSSVYWTVTYYEGRPTDSQLDRAKGLRLDLDKAQLKAQALFGKELDKVNDLLSKDKIAKPDAANISLDNNVKLKVLTREEFDMGTR